MVRLRPVVAACVASLLAASPVLAQGDRELRERAYELGFNLDHAEALQLLRQAVARDPSDPQNHRALAATLWVDILFQRGAVTVDHYLGGISQSNIAIKNPPPDLDAEFRRETAQAIELSEREVAAHPKAARAHLDLGTSLGLQASYMASVEGRLMAGFRAARRSYDECEMALALDPSRKEPALIVGTYRYIVSTLSLPLRVMAYVVGFGGGKERGLQLVEETAASDAENRTDAKFALVLLYNREKRYDDALRVLAGLRNDYPRNRLVVLEIGSTSLRAGRAQQADAVLSDGLQMLAKDRRPRIPGESGLWHYKRGAARLQLKRFADARADLAVALQGDSLPWVQGRAHLEMARMAVAQGDTTAARREASAAIASCQAGNDPICVDEARKIK